MRKIVVTGGAGRLARFVIDDLLAHGFSVLAVDSVRPDRLRCRFVRADLTDAGSVYDVFRGAEGVIHLGAIPGPTIEAPSTTYRNNVIGTWNVVEAAAALGAAKLVFASSIFALGWNEEPHAWWPRYVPVDETHPLTPFEAYGLSKQAGEDLCAAVSRRSGLACVSLRFMNIVAPESYTSFPWPAPTKERGVRFVMWPWVDIRDAAVACRQALTAPISGHEAIYIAGTQTRFSSATRDLLRELAPPVEIRGPMAGNATVISLEKASRLLGFAPQHQW